MSKFLKGPWWEETLRGIFAIPTGGLSEVLGRDNQFGRTVSGGAEGGIGGFITGGPIGAVMGAGTGAGLSGTGTTDPYSLKGGAINFGSGSGAGALPGFGSWLGSIGSGSAAAAGSAGSTGSGMTPYMPTSTPNMGAAGSTLGPGGMFSNLNPMGPGMSASGGASSAFSLSNALKLMRSMPQGGGQQQQSASQPGKSQEDLMRMLYQMFPNLNPGGQTSQVLRSGRNQWL